MAKEVVIAALLLSAAAVSSALSVAEDAAFETFVATHGKKYAHVAEKSTRKRIFNENMRRAAELQAANPHATFGANEFSDMTPEEFQAYHNGAEYFKREVARQQPVADLFTKEQISAGSSIDWRKKGAVTAVKNQGQCGSCWSFSATGSIEGQWFLAGHALVSVSEQELVSCDTTDSGCNGGLMDNAWAWLLANKGGWIDTEASYPYVSGSGFVPACKSSGHTNGAKITGHKDLPHNEAQMGEWMLTHGPISIAVDATSFQSYNSGILTNCISQQIDHGVLAVGFDDNNVPPYWIIKNSWGASWGESGYIRVQKGTNQCLITTLPCTSVV